MISLIADWFNSGDNAYAVIIIVLVLAGILLLIASKRSMKELHQLSKELDQLKKHHEQHHAILNGKDVH